MLGKRSTRFEQRYPRRAVFAALQHPLKPPASPSTHPSASNSPFTVIPTSLHFWNRQYWHCVRVFLVIKQSLFLTHLYFKSSPLTERRKNFYANHLRLSTARPWTYLARFTRDRTAVQTRRLLAAHLTRFEARFEQDRQGIVGRLGITTRKSEKTHFHQAWPPLCSIPDRICCPRSRATVRVGSNAVRTCRSSSIESRPWDTSTSDYDMAKRRRSEQAGGTSADDMQSFILNRREKKEEERERERKCVFDFSICDLCARASQSEPGLRAFFLSVLLSRKHRIAHHAGEKPISVSTNQTTNCQSIVLACPAV